MMEALVILRGRQAGPEEAIQRIRLAATDERQRNIQIEEAVQAIQLASADICSLVSMTEGERLRAVTELCRHYGIAR
jgi:hypothetical protein